MGESGSQQRREPAGHDDGDMIKFGGLPVRWPFPDIHWPRVPQLPPSMRVTVTIGLATLAAGLLIGFVGGRLTTHQAVHKARSFETVTNPSIVPPLATTAIGLTGARCAVQIGNNLQLGLEITNETRSMVTLDLIRPVFPLGGLRDISSGVGTCGALPPIEVTAPTALAPGDTEWIHITVAVRNGCPEPLPVWIKLRYVSAGQTHSALLAGFPDLGPVSYRRCKGTDAKFSFAISTVEPSRGHSSIRG